MSDFSDYEKLMSIFHENKYILSEQQKIRLGYDIYRGGNFSKIELLMYGLFDFRIFVQYYKRNVRQDNCVLEYIYFYYLYTAFPKFIADVDTGAFNITDKKWSQGVYTGNFFEIIKLILENYDSPENNVQENIKERIFALEI